MKSRLSIRLVRLQRLEQLRRFARIESQYWTGRLQRVEGH